MKIKRKLIGGLAAAVIGFSGACVPIKTSSQGDDFINFLGYNGAQTFMNESIKKEMGHVDYRENARGVSNSVPQEYQRGPEMFVYHHWEDLNGNGKHDSKEFFGSKNKIFNLNKESLYVEVWNRDYIGPVIFRAWNSKGEMIAETKDNTFKRPFWRSTWYTTPETKLTTGDFIDKIKEAGSGEYKITATFDDGKTFIEDIIIKNK